MPKPKKVKLPVPTEKQEHAAFVKWFKVQYRGMLLHTDYAAGMKMNMGQAVECARLQGTRAWLDIFIPEPYTKLDPNPTLKSSGIVIVKAGLFIELKRKGELRNKDGTIKVKWHYRYSGTGKSKVLIEKFDHHAEQQSIIDRLNAKGYAAFFAEGMEEAISITNKYFSGQL